MALFSRPVLCGLAAFGTFEGVLGLVAAGVTKIILDGKDERSALVRSALPKKGIRRFFGVAGLWLVVWGYTSVFVALDLIQGGRWLFNDLDEEVNTDIIPTTTHPRGSTRTSTTTIEYRGNDYIIRTTRTI
ncbi:hypothetical protein F5Y13DRAFT_192982 [Hypoxylon sp. FL1857]|nr:hypothetical protein F5Y13DRAFT_192982 [Hypoxylon sp. FL1857]